MASNVNPIFLETARNVGVKITAADTTNKKTAFSAGVDGGAVISLSACSFDAADRVVILSYNDGTTSYQLGEISVPAGSGTNGTAAAVNLLDPEKIRALDSDDSFVLKASGVFEVAAKVTVAGDIHIAGIAGDF